MFLLGVGGRLRGARCSQTVERGFGSCWERELLAGAAAPASPGRREARTWGFYSEHLR